MPVGQAKESPISTASKSGAKSLGEVRTESNADRGDPTAGSQRAGTAVLVVSEIGRRDPTGPGWLIRDVSFAINCGERLVVAGATGSGKTVLLRALALLDPLSAGWIRWRGEAVCGAAVPGYRSQVIYLPQRPAIFEGSVEQNLENPYTLNAHRARAFNRDRVIEYLERVGRSPAFLAKPGRELSGGEAQIVALLRAVQLDPSVLLLDEPTASLDKAAAGLVESLVDDWFRAGQGTRALVWVSHDPEQLGRVADRYLCMRNGRLNTEQ
jgi:putative ABC transport system ATP-binding protein